jgi:hypothetical protein
MDGSAPQLYTALAKCGEKTTSLSPQRQQVVRHGTALRRQHKNVLFKSRERESSTPSTSNAWGCESPMASLRVPRTIEFPSTLKCNVHVKALYDIPL